MKIMFLFIVLAAVAYGSSWTFLADLPQNGSPEDIHIDENDLYVVTFEELVNNTILRSEVLIGANGLQDVVYSDSDPTANRTDVSVFPVSPCLEVLESIEKDGETLKYVIPCENGGCFAAYMLDNSDFIWKVYRLSEIGEIMMNGEFQMQGGPVISISTVKETADSGLVLCGTTDDLGMNLYMFAIGIDADGLVSFEIKEDFNFHSSGDLLEIDDEGNIYIAGYTGFEREDGIFLPPSDSDIFLMKLDSSGREIWRTVYNYPLENRPSMMHINEDGSIAMVIKSFSYEPTDSTSHYSLIVFQYE